MIPSITNLIEHYNHHKKYIEFINCHNKVVEEFKSNSDMNLMNEMLARCIRPIHNYQPKEKNEISS